MRSRQGHQVDQREDHRATLPNHIPARRTPCSPAKSSIRAPLGWRVTVDGADRDSETLSTVVVKVEDDGVTVVLADKAAARRATLPVGSESV